MQIRTPLFIEFTITERDRADFLIRSVKMRFTAQTVHLQVLSVPTNAVLVQLCQNVRFRSFSNYYHHRMFDFYARLGPYNKVFPPRKC